MKKPLLLLSIVSAVFSIAYSQTAIVKPTEIQFRSDFEKQAFENFTSKSNSDLFGLLMASGSLMNDNAIEQARKRLYDYLASYKTEKFASKKPDKQVKQAYDEIHKTFLVKYELKNNFEKLLYDGSYNCVSGTALFALTFEFLKIPYVIKEKPTHVYLIAYPDSHQIIVETTTPAAGYVTMSPQFKQAFVKMLADQKLVAASEVGSRSVDETFEKYYFGSQENIDVGKLAGLQYFNAGLDLHDDEKYELAYHEFEKGYVLYPSDRLGYMLMASLRNALVSRDSKDSIHATILGKLSRHQRFGIKNEMIESEFAGAVQKTLFENGDSKALDQYYTTLTRYVTDSTLRKEIDFIYRYETGRYAYNQGNFKEAISHYEVCLRLKPKHQDANRITVAAVAQWLSNTDAAEVGKQLEQFAKRIPSLTGQKVFLQMQASAYLAEMESKFYAEDASAGEKSKAVFENFMAANKDVPVNAVQLGNAYSAAVVYYFRKGANQKAKMFIEQGLRYSPDNYQLLARKRMLNQ